MHCGAVGPGHLGHRLLELKQDQEKGIKMNKFKAHKYWLITILLSLSSVVSAATIISFQPNSKIVAADVNTNFANLNSALTTLQSQVNTLSSTVTALQARTLQIQKVTQTFQVGPQTWLMGKVACPAGYTAVGVSCSNPEINPPMPLTYSGFSQPSESTQYGYCGYTNTSVAGATQSFVVIVSCVTFQ
jgi:hypothetical protein